MSEHNRDPIQDLEHFGTGGISVTPLDPAAVRRLGDKRRTRTRASIAIAATVLAVVGAVIPATLAMTDDSPAPTPPANTPTPTPSSSPAPPVRNTIAEDFPLDVGAPADVDEEDGERNGPAATATTATPKLCGTDVIAAVPTQDRLGFNVSGQLHREERELRTYADAPTSAAVLAALQQELTRCSSWTDGTVERTVIPFTSENGRATVTFAVAGKDAAGKTATDGVIYQVAQVGSALVTVAEYGEIDVASVRPAEQPAITFTTTLITPAMCVFTDTGCRSTTPPASGADHTFTYQGLRGVTVGQAADAQLLRGSSEAFQQFILALDAQTEGTADCPAGASVLRYSTAGYAIGFPGGCRGTAEAIWSARSGAWKEVLRIDDWMLGTWKCSDLAGEGIPRSFVGGCRDEGSGRFEREGDFGPVFVDGIGLHMSAEQVEAAGGSVRWPNPEQGCGSFYLPGLTPGVDHPSGAISDRGVVSIHPVTHPGDGMDLIQRMLTPEGVGLVMSRPEVEKAYPEGTFVALRAAWMVPVTDRGRYRFNFNEYDEVVGLSLEATDQNCFE